MPNVIDSHSGTSTPAQAVMEVVVLSPLSFENVN